MIDEEKQPDNTSQQIDEPIAASQENYGDESAAMEGDLSLEMGLESLPNLQEPTTGTSTAEVATEEGDNRQTVTAESATDGNLAALESLRRENEALRTQIQELTQQNDSFKTQAVRIAADFDNFRKRTAKEKEDLEQQVKGATLTDLLPVVDNFERARSQLKPQTDGEMAIHKSYQGVYKQLVDGLKRLGVSAMRPEGQEFDPNLHEAVMREPTNEYPEGVVIEQLMRGYFLGERVLRHAMVKVAAPGEPVVTSEEGSPETTES